MNDREFWTEDRQFGLKISNVLIEYLLERCRQGLPNETGGIIIGFYNEGLNCAVVTAFTAPTKDSLAGKNWFYRGIKGLQSKLNHLWRTHRHYYLGEWHFHPFGSPAPSPRDIIQMYEIAANSKYNCPEAILLILGGNPSGDWSIRGYVFRHLQKLMELIEKP